MRKSSVLKFFIIPSLIIFLIFELFFLQSRINHLRKGPIQGPLYLDPTEAIPMMLLGSFRGIMVDFLWIKAIARHEEKKYYDLLAINNMIAKLQPRFPAVWMFQAWNMSYNIAHEWDSPENKWEWIKAGLEFAEKGALKNPTNGDLLFEIGHIYFHRFSSRTFKHIDYYRERLRVESGKDNYKEAVYWIKKSLDHNPVLRKRVVIERTLCIILWNASLRTEKEGKLVESLEYATQSIKEWEAYLERHPDDPGGKAGHYLRLINEKKLQLEQHIS